MFFAFFVLILVKKDSLFQYYWYICQRNYHGVLNDSAEIIPIEPDAGNAAAGMMKI